MKRIPLYTALISLAFFGACDDVFDINKDPLAPTTSNPNAVLPFVFVNYSARKISEFAVRTGDVFHYFSATTGSPSRGSLSSFLKGNTWREYYENLGNLKLIENDAKAAGESNNNIQAVSLIMQAQIFFELTSMFEDIPYAQAIDVENFPKPTFSTQEEVLDGLVTQLDKAIELIDALPKTGNFDFTSGDLLLGGDMERWRALANSIKIRILMLIYNVDSRKAGAAQLLTDAFAQKTISSPVFLKYSGESGAKNAYFLLLERYLTPSNETSFFYGPSPIMTNTLRELKDPRLELWLVDLGGTNTYPTADYGTYPENDEAVYADKLIRADYPDIYFLPGELSFYKAELALQGVAVSGSAQENFEAGIRSTLKYWGGEIDGFQGTPITDSRIDTYIGNVGAVTLDKIHIQQWLEGFLRPVVGWNTVRRTGVPFLRPPGGATITTILKRFSYPAVEIATNEINIPNNNALDVPMWFENR